MKTRRKFLGSLPLLGVGLALSNPIKAKPEKSIMIHQVFFWLKNPEKDLKSVKKGCQKLAKIKFVKKAFIGVPAPTANRPVVDHSFHISLTIHFESLDDHDFYQKNDDHLKFVERHEHKWEKVSVFDIHV
ncbi:Dabb family protein [Echinicola jeungdonensis]|uniref:Dabb family protein n=1 Tax=Echinicola jeungdonensis TaxID=709343 RepID=A0ABV5J272_9BACT|nr:Dabb family protein [Echinicola jeungdonensis]MDN3667842.1 Dabb family protein [Echinicola jeungdonensis]